MLETYSEEQLRGLVGHEVHDRDDQVVGYVDLMFQDANTNRLERMGVWNGLPGGKRHLVPLDGATQGPTRSACPGPRSRSSPLRRTTRKTTAVYSATSRTSGSRRRKRRRPSGLTGSSAPLKPERVGRACVWIYEERAERIVR